MARIRFSDRLCSAVAEKWSHNLQPDNKILSCFLSPYQVSLSLFILLCAFCDGK